jgi:putative tryptophan/tyrosine transport system substrate-binding protein
MKRREFITLVGGATAAWPLKAMAQQAPGLARVGLLAFGQELDGPLVRVFRDEMQKLGQAEGQSYMLEFRSARGDPGRLRSAAAELAQMRVDVIVTDSGAASIAAKKATATVPIVMGVISDPIELGLVASLARPGGNVTGFSIISPQLGTKRLALLKEAVPEARLVGVLVNPASGATGPQQLAPINDAATVLGIGLAVGEASSADTIPDAIDRLIARRIMALMVVGDAVFFAQRKLIVERANASRLPAIYPEREFAEAGGLLAYGPNIPENFRRAAGYVTRILRGEKAGELPVEQPAKFELVINLRTAKSIGFVFPPALPLLADEVIE